MQALRVFLLATFLLFAHFFRAQPDRCPKVPDSYKWETAREYKRDEELVLKTLQWLTTTPINSEIASRGKANLFVMEWICGSPRIEIEIDSDMLSFYINYPDLLFPYIHGIAQCKLSKNSACNELEAMVSGFDCVAFMIKTDEHLKKAKDLQPIVKAYKKNKMDLYVEAIMKNKTEK
jgi:hypothetical protein